MKLKTPKELGITPTQFKNLCKLTTFVRTKVPPPKFDIREYYQPKGHDIDSGNIPQPNEAKYECGTSACFCGYGPLAGIKPKRGEEWADYAERVFGASMWGHIYSLLFSGSHLNDRDAAVRRGAYFLTHGLPVKASFSKWEAPESFRPPWKLIAQHANS